MFHKIIIMRFVLTQINPDYILETLDCLQSILINNKIDIK